MTLCRTAYLQGRGKVMNNMVTQNILDYILGGKACFRIVQDSTKSNRGGSAVYVVNKDKYKDGKFFLYVVKGNSRMFIGSFNRRYLGSLDINTSRSKDYEREVNAFLVTVNCLANKGTLPGNGIVHIVHDCRCAVCRRRLTDEKSVEYGIGPECRKKLKVISNHRSFAW